MDEGTPGQQDRWLTNAEYHRELQRKGEACERLLMIGDQMAGSRFEVQPVVAGEEWARATKSYRATIVLAARGFGQQAQVLARSVFESAMLVRWALSHPDLADEYVHLHALLALDLHIAARRNAGFWDKKPILSTITRDERERAVALFGRRGTGYWSGHRQLEELVDANAEEITDPYLARQFKALFTVMIAWSNRMAHSTGISTRAQRSEDPHDPDATDDTAVLITGPSRHQVFDAMHTAATSYTLLMGDLLPTIAPDRVEDLRRASGLIWRAWKDPAELEGLSDDDPCPCDEPDTLWGECHKWTEELVSPARQPRTNRQQRRTKRRSKRR